MATRKSSSAGLGAKIKKLRRAKKVKLKDLANETGYTPEYIKQIEGDEIIPPVAVLIQLSKAMAVNSGRLLVDEEKKERKREGYLKRTQAYNYKTLTPGTEKKHLSAFLVTIDAKEDHKMVEYRHEGEEFIYVQEGKIEIIVGENRTIIKKGNCFHFNSAITHQLNNLGEKEARLLVVIYTP